MLFKRNDSANFVLIKMDEVFKKNVPKKREKHKILC